MKNTVTAYVGMQPVLLYVPEVFTCKSRPFSVIWKMANPSTLQCRICLKYVVNVKSHLWIIWHVHVSTDNLNISKRSNSTKSKFRFQTLKQYQSSLWNISMAIIMGINIINISYTCGAMPETSLLHLCSPRCTISMCSACQSCTQQTITRPSPGVNLAPNSSTASKSHAWISQI